MSASTRVILKLGGSLIFADTRRKNEAAEWFFLRVLSWTSPLKGPGPLYFAVPHCRCTVGTVSVASPSFLRTHPVETKFIMCNSPAAPFDLYVKIKYNIQKRRKIYTNTALAPLRKTHDTILSGSSAPSKRCERAGTVAS